MREKHAPSQRRGAFAALVVASLFASCESDESRVREIADSRTYEPVDGGFKWGASPQERFRFSMPQPPTAGGGGSGGHSGTGDLHWTTPEGWQEVATSALRQANFQIGDDGTECYLTILNGDGGGLAANMNRWRKQMSLPEASSEEIAALPKANFFGELASFIDVEGTFTGMSGDQAGADYRMLGLAQVADGKARFLKLIGPKATVSAQVEAFKALAVSFHSDHGDEPPSQQGDPHAGLDLGTEQALAASNRGKGVQWKNPGGWNIGPERPMRAVTFTIGEDNATECYVVVLSGEGGGVPANINRWRTQMGAADLSQAELAALPRVPMLGTEGIVVEIPGAYTGMGDADVPDALLLGAVIMLPQSSVFVKMVGPKATVEASREAFDEFCKSMEAVQ